jgi:hypothetical protein
MKKDGSICGIFLGAFFEYCGEKLGEKSLEFIELCLVLKASVTLGNGSALDHFCKVVSCLLAVNENGLDLLFLYYLRLKSQGADKHYRNTANEESGESK